MGVCPGRRPFYGVSLCLKNGSSLSSSEDEGLGPKKETINHRCSLQRIKRLAFCLSVRGFTNSPICQALSDNAGYRLTHTGGIGRLAGIPFVIPLAEIAM